MIDILLAEKNLILVCGSGGVGKTTTAAALSLRAAQLNKKVIVLTIDPAKRLATSLGLQSLTSEPKRINPQLMEPQKNGREPELWAMMLDTKRTFDQLVTRYAPSKEVEKKILSNKIYKHLSNMMAGSQEYMAMEKLYEFHSEGKWDLIVIDTPPTTHAIDFLNAPQKMIDAIGHSMIHLLLKPAMMMGKGGLKLLEKGSEMILRIFDRITGFAFLQDISEMLISFKGLLHGFEGRALEVRKILTDAKTAFVLVSACEEKSVEEASFFIKKLSELELPLAGILLNRVHPYYEKSAGRIEEETIEMGQMMGDETVIKMMECFNRFQKMAKRDLSYKKRLSHELKTDQFISTIPLFESDIHDLSGLYRLGNYL